MNVLLFLSVTATHSSCLTFVLAQAKIFAAFGSCSMGTSSILKEVLQLNPSKWKRGTKLIVCWHRLEATVSCNVR
jgi:hypothetical protein